MKVVTIVGARPQFVKAAMLSRTLAKHGIDEILVHTGQHYDYAMSTVFFDELALRPPVYSLDVGSASHGKQTGDMLSLLEPIVEREAPDWVLIYGDTNSTLAGALSAAKLGIPLAHVEAGMRSFNRSAPEEINRIVADHVSDLHLVSNELASRNLAVEGLSAAVVIVGDLMIDLALQTAEELPVRPHILARFGLAKGMYALATIHRAINTSTPAIFRRLITGLRATGLPVVFPVHPRTQSLAHEFGVGAPGDSIRTCDPVSYADMIALERDACVVLTDSGGMQKEAFALGVPCVTMRDETEWVDTLAGGWNVLAGSDPVEIARAARRPAPDFNARAPLPFVGECAERIATALSGRSRYGNPVVRMRSSA